MEFTMSDSGRAPTLHAFDQLRAAILHRIEHRTASIGSIAWAANISPSHLVNFVRHHRDLGADAFKRVCAVVGFDAELVPVPGPPPRIPEPPPPAVRRTKRPPRPRARRSASPAAVADERAKSHKKP